MHRSQTKTLISTVSNVFKLKFLHTVDSILLMYILIISTGLNKENLTQVLVFYWRLFFIEINMCGSYNSFMNRSKELH